MSSLINKIMTASVLLSGLTISSFALAQGSFDGHNVNVKFEIWELDSDKNIIETLLVRNEANIVASDASSPDLIGFHAQVENHLWDIDFNNRVIKLVFTSITDPNYDNAGMWLSPLGFHLEDVDGTLPEIVGIKVNDQYAPSFFNKALVKFDANNIYVNLQGSMCHIDGMGSMPECDNEKSPTTYNNIIEIEVEFASDIVGNEEIDQMLDWAEGKYPELLTSHQESRDIMGYRARYYEQSNFYVGIKDQRLYAFGTQVGGMLDLGPVSTWIGMMHQEMHNHGDGGMATCPDGQHMMGDGTCMSNTAM